MDAERWERINEIFFSAVERAPDQRAAYLNEACGSDAELRRELEGMLASDALGVTQNFLSPAPLNVKEQFVGSGRSDPFIGKRIGAFEIKHLIGKGGMGYVYLAVRTVDFKQRVAVKIMKRGVDTEEILQRFRTEIRVLAALSRHPNIAGLLDAGTTDDGLPYFIMEYVEGERIDLYCDRNKLNTRERLALFRSVCDAVEFAHQHTIIHRDLKPGNILVSSEGRLKLIDFGIAKLAVPELSFQTASMTHPDLRPMTPQYASPEQIRGDPLSTATDIYSLGVVLYELLTGHRPYQLQTPLPHQIERIVCEREPEKPSTVVGRTETVQLYDDHTTQVTPELVSKSRGTETPQLRRTLRGDVDNIVLKAMRKEPRLRYDSVAELSEDIQGFLDGRPVEARPLARVERMWRWCRRNPAVASLAVATVALLLATTITSTVSAVRIGAARNDAELARDEAEQNAGNERLARSAADRALKAEQRLRAVADANLARAQQAEREAEHVADFLIGLFQGSDPIGLGGYLFGPGEAGPDVTAREMLDRGADKISQELDDQPVVQARLMDTIGIVYVNLGVMQQGTMLIESALDMRRQLFDGAHPEVAQSLHNLGTLRYLQGSYDEAEELLRRALNMRRQLLGEEDLDTVRSKFMLTWVLLETDYSEEAEQLLRDVVDVRRRILKRNDRDVAFALAGLALVYAHKGEALRAFDYIRQALQILNQQEQDDGSVEIFALAVRGVALAQAGQTEQAVEVFRQALEKARQVVGETHFAVSHLEMALASFLVDNGDFKGAASVYRDALERGLRVYGRQPRVAETMFELADILCVQREFDESEQLYQEALEIQRRVLGESHLHVANSLNGLAMTRYARGDHSQVGEHFARALEILERRLGENSQFLLMSLNGLAAVHDARGEHEKAEFYWQRAERIVKSHLEESHRGWRLRSTAFRVSSLGALMAENGEHEPAARVLRQALDLQEASLRRRDWRTAQTQLHLGSCYVFAGRFDEAEPLLLESYPVFEAKFGIQHPRTNEALSSVVAYFEAAGMNGKAEEYRAKLGSRN